METKQASKTKRKIIHIDEELCNGCGNCIPACPEQALQIVETDKGPKARLVKELYCDGLGACLGNCPTNALTIIEEEAVPYDEEATTAHIKEMLEKHINHQKQQEEKVAPPKPACNCPGAAVAQWESNERAGTALKRASSALRQWPVQINLVPAGAPFLRNADIAVIADCVPFAYANLHEDIMKGRIVLVGCPKFDDAEAYIEKIAQIIEQAHPQSIRVVRMEVPCCSGLTRIIQEAKERMKSDVPVEEVVIGIKGDMLLS